MGFVPCYAYLHAKQLPIFKDVPKSAFAEFDKEFKTC